MDKEIEMKWWFRKSFIFRGGWVLRRKAGFWQLLKIVSKRFPRLLLPGPWTHCLNFFFCPKNIINNNQTCKIIDHAKTSERRDTRFGSFSPLSHRTLMCVGNETSSQSWPKKFFQQIFCFFLCSAAGVFLFGSNDCSWVVSAWTPRAPKICRKY